MSTVRTDQPIRLPTETINPFDPPAKLAELRDTRPLCRLVFPDGHLGWLITSHSLAKEMYADARFSMQPVASMPIEGHQGMSRVRELLEGEDMFLGNILDMDPPEHTKFRRTMAKHFTTARVTDHRGAIETAAAERLDAMAAGERPVDLLTAYGLPVVTASHAALFNIPREGSELIVQAVVAFAEAVSNPAGNADDGVQYLQKVRRYVSGVIDAKRESPSDDLIGSMIASRDLTSDEIMSAIVMLTIGGIETTASMIAGGMFALLSHPEQLEALRADPSLIDDAVDELLRYFSLFKTNFTRTAGEDVEIGGELIRAGERVTVSLTAVNHDPARFENPGELDVRRNAKGHMAFGHGIHVCIGQHLARLEMRIALAALIERFPTLRLAVPAEQVPMEDDDHILHAAKKVEVTW